MTIKSAIEWIIVTAVAVVFIDLIFSMFGFGILVPLLP